MKKGFHLKKLLFRLLSTLLLLGIIGYTAYKVSPWPTALVLRYAFDAGAEKKSGNLEKYVPAGITALYNRQYDAADSDARLDVYYPTAASSSATIVWTHGGGWLSGNKEQLANYCKILASKGFTVVAIDYALAPAAHYPTPVKQLNTALGYLLQNSRQLHITPNRMVLAGDSAGAHITAQLAAICTSPAYAAGMGIKPAIAQKALTGVLLYCGPYDLGKIDIETGFNGLAKSILWAYCGTKDFTTHPDFALASVNRYVTKNFPATFISAGNGDSLLLQSQVLAQHLGQLGVTVDSLFFPKTYTPKLPHEYQFDLDTEAGKLALERTAAFINEQP